MTLALTRHLPRSSPVHAAWAGTKITSLVVVSIGLAFSPGWPSLAVGAPFVVLGWTAARLPWGAVPRPPRWFGLLLAAGGVFTAVDGGLVGYLQLLVLGATLVGLAILLLRTTPVADLGSALGTLLVPLGLLGVPVGELAVALALCVRFLPLLAGELHTLGDALVLRRRARRNVAGEPAPTTSLREDLRVLQDAAVDVLAVTIRRAGETAEAIAARGGPDRHRQPRPGLRWADVAVAGVSLAAALAIMTSPHWGP